MKVLVLVQAYPDAQNKKLMYVHVRNQYYRKNGIDVTVLNFGIKQSYLYEGINVISEADFEKKEAYDILICHAPNIRNHYRFLRKNGSLFPRFVFFFHGHEIMYLSKEYPTNYSYQKEATLLRTKFQDIYDIVKCRIWRGYYLKVREKSDYIFVSDYLKKCFLKYLHIDKASIEKNSHIINNSVGEVFEENDYCRENPVAYDFITIRSNFDGSTYCIDLVNKWAGENPQFKFLLIGKGDYFLYNQKASNIDLLEKHLTHDEMMNFLNKSKVALMPTRHDTQGVMSCEMATYGIPLITSKIDICKEIFSEYSNVILISNDATNEEFLSTVQKAFALASDVKEKLYTAKDTLEKELKLLNMRYESQI